VIENRDASEERALSAGPALSRLLPIGPRAKGGPALSLAYVNLHFNRSSLHKAGVGPTVFL